MFFLGLVCLLGNWIVNKNKIPFCAIGADHALEHLNRSMKVTGGLIGLTLNAAARDRFFLIAPEMQVLIAEAKNLSDCTDASSSVTHHSFNSPVINRQMSNARKIVSTLETFTNPFTYDDTNLINMVTKSVMPEDITNDVCSHDRIGQKLYSKFCEDHIKSASTNLWDPMKKVKIKTFKSAAKAVRVRVKDQIVQLKEDRALFARMLIVARSRPEIDLQECISMHEFSVVPRSLFAADGSLLHCSMKSQLMKLLESASTIEPNSDIDVTSVEKKVAIVDGMAEVQCLYKPTTIKTCKDLSQHFVTQFNEKYKAYDEVHLVFDDYTVTNSLKTATRQKRQGISASVHYKIGDTTKIQHITMKRLLSHTKTKDELTDYLSKKMMEDAENTGNKFVVAWRQNVSYTTEDIYADSSHEEADTKLIFHSVAASENGAKTLHVYSPDTDVFVLLLRRYPLLCNSTSFITGVGKKQRQIDLKPIYEAVGPDKISALPGFHAFTGADVTGSFSGKGKRKWWTAFMDAEEDVISALTELGTSNEVNENVYVGLEKFVCSLYTPKTKIFDIGKVRWMIFREKQQEGEKLPPTRSALKPAIQRAHFQSIVWFRDVISHQNLPPFVEYGWSIDEHGLASPITMTLPPAPDAIIELVKYGCVQSKCENARCKCVRSGLECTELCGCWNEDDDNCKNVNLNAVNKESDEDSDNDMI